MAGKTVLLVHPAWHSCGSHQVFASQARAYRGLGARVVSLAIADLPGAVEGSRAHKTYAAATPDLEADLRLYSGMPLLSVPNPAFLRAARLWLHGNFAAILLESARLAPIPAALEAERIDLIHCNHFFCMPVAMGQRDGHGCAVLLDSHDLQARQYALRNEQGWALPPVAKFEDMLEIERAAMRGADALLHLNDEEAAAFKALLPEKRHELIYPAVPAIEPGMGGDDLLIVASANYANYLGLAWFLQDVLPLVPDEVRRRVKIVGNIAGALRARAPALFRANAGLFHGHVRDLGEAYASAAAVLLPTTEGHGVSIKSIEAMSSGAPLIATAHAFRGMRLDPAKLNNVTLANDAPAFAAAMQAASSQQNPASRQEAQTRKFYQSHFAAEAYRAALAKIATPLLKSPLI